MFDTMKRNKFPLEVYPKKLQELVDETNKCYDYSKEYLSLALLVACSAAMGYSVTIRFNEDFIETAMIFAVIIGKPNTGKTHPLKYALEPIIKKDEEMFQNYRQEMKEYQQAKKNDSSAEIPIPKFSKQVVKDFTIEALCTQLKDSPRGILLYMDEIMGWLRNMNKYTGGSDITNYLSIWSKESISVDRKTSESIRIPKPFLSIIGGIQTGILSELITKELLHCGFLDRILFAMPQNEKITEWTEMSVSRELKEWYYQFIETLFAVPLEKMGENIIPTVLDLSPEAKEHIISWRNTIHKNTLQNNEGETYAGAYGKMDIYVLRFALILQMMYYAAGEESMNCVGIRAVEGAICLVNYFMQEIKKVHELVFAKDIRQEMSEDKRKFYEALPSQFKLKEGIDLGIRMGLTYDSAKKFISKKSEYFERGAKGSGIYKKIFIEDEE